MVTKKEIGVVRVAKNVKPVENNDAVDTQSETYHVGVIIRRRLDFSAMQLKLAKCDIVTPRIEEARTDILRNIYKGVETEIARSIGALYIPEDKAGDIDFLNHQINTARNYLFALNDSIQGNYEEEIKYEIIEEQPFSSRNDKDRQEHSGS